MSAELMNKSMMNISNAKFCCTILNMDLREIYIYILSQVEVEFAQVTTEVFLAYCWGFLFVCLFVLLAHYDSLLLTVKILGNRDSSFLPF